MLMSHRKNPLSNGQVSIQTSQEQWIRLSYWQVSKNTCSVLHFVA